MNTQDAFQLIQAKVSAPIQLLEGPTPSILVRPQGLVEVLTFAKEDPQLDCQVLTCQTGSHQEDEIRLFYHLLSHEQNHLFVFECPVPLSDPKAPSVTSLWPAANWLERETYDLLGVHFEGHPDLRRIMLPEDWEGFPLRKDYVTPTSYHDSGFDLTVDNRPSAITQSFNLSKGDEKEDE